MHTLIAPLAGLLVMGVIAGIVVGFILFGRRGRIVMAACLVVVVGLVAWELLRDKSETLWVNHVTDDHAVVTFVVPTAGGFVAQGTSSAFNSNASPDEVFAAFHEAFPHSQRDGNTAVVVIDGHDYSLIYRPDGPDFDWHFRNDEPQGPDEVYEDGFGSTNRPDGLGTEEWLSDAGDAVHAAGAANGVTIFSVTSKADPDELAIAIVGDPTDSALIERIKASIVPVALEWSPYVTIRMTAETPPVD